MSTNMPITKENLNHYMKELSKEYHKLSGKTMPAEIILIGGASILANYGFREMTYDMDAIITASSAMKEAINHVGDRLGLPNGWLNTDFVKTRSYTPKLIEHSVYYKTFSNILTIRTVYSEYLIAMKLMSGRKFKNDLSDVIGILYEHKLKGEPISRDQINNAVTNLYGGWDSIPKDSRIFLDSAMKDEDYETLFDQYHSEEQNNRYVLLDFDKRYPGATNENNVEDILKVAKAKKAKQDQD